MSAARRMTWARTSPWTRGPVRDRRGAGGRPADVPGRAFRCARRRGAIADAARLRQRVGGNPPGGRTLAGLKVDAIMVIGTSLTFYRGVDAHDELMAKLRATTGLPVSTMSQAVVDGLMSFSARRIAVATAYADEVNNRLRAFLTAKGLEVLALEGFGLFGFGEPDTKSEADIIALGSKVCVAAPAADGLLISCGGLRTLGVAKPLEQRHGIPV